MNKVIIAGIIGIVTITLGIVISYEVYMVNALKTGHHEQQTLGGNGGTIWVQDLIIVTNVSTLTQ